MTQRKRQAIYAKILISLLVVLPIGIIIAWWITRESNWYYKLVLNNHQELVLSVRDAFCKSNSIFEVRKIDKNTLRMCVGSRASIVEKIMYLDKPDITVMQKPELDKCIQLIDILDCIRLYRDVVTGEFEIMLSVSGIVPSGRTKCIVWNPSKDCIKQDMDLSTRTCGVKYEPIEFLDNWYFKEEWN